MAELVNDDTFRSLEGKSKHQLWLELCDIITKHPKDVLGLKVDAVLRSGIRKFTDEVCVSSMPACPSCCHLVVSVFPEPRIGQWWSVGPDFRRLPGQGLLSDL